MSRSRSFDFYPMNIVRFAVRQICELMRKAFGIMENSGGERGTEGAGGSVPATKRARTTSISGAGSRLTFFNSSEENDKSMLATELESCQSQLSDRDLKIVKLENSAIASDQVRLELEQRVAIMQQQLWKAAAEGCVSYADGAATPFLFESTLKALQISVKSFSNVFLGYAKSHSVDANQALRKHYDNPFLTRPGHVIVLLREWTFKSIFLDFENESFSCGGTSIFLDLTERRVKSFEHFQQLETNGDTFDPCAEDWFKKFRLKKLRQFLSLWQSSDQATAMTLSSNALEDLRTEDPKVRLMESFRSVAKGVWALHKLSLSFPIRAEIFRVSQYNVFSEDYMESFVTREDDKQFVSKVGFMICPGFRRKRSVLKCQIYLARDPKLCEKMCRSST